tara:strand:+ start:276 stop:455 length:180 start_codon:yes stop_codon:yes gene_type:complete
MNWNRVIGTIRKQCAQLIAEQLVSAHLAWHWQGPIGGDSDPGHNLSASDDLLNFKQGAA